MALYYPEIFNVADIEAAKDVILTNEGPGADTDTRWSVETPYVMSLIAGALAPNAGTLVLDYGCGIGRMAKAMIDTTGCSVIGVDISASMRSLANDYVASERFTALSPQQFDRLTASGLRVDAAISIWVLQHCFAPANDIARIHRGLVPGGGCFILNMPKRAVPARLTETAGNRFDWLSDGIDVKVLLREAFLVEAEGEPDQSGLPNMADAGAYWMRLRAD
jgi:SAM-dependent methyltransferase